MTFENLAKTHPVARAKDVLSPHEATARSSVTPGYLRRIEENDLVTTDYYNAAIEARPELKRWKLMSESTQAAEQQARSGYYPAVSVSAGYGGENAVLEGRIGGEVHGWIAGVKATWDVFDGHLTDAKVAESVADRAIYDAGARKEREDITLEVRKAHLALRSAERMIQSGDKKNADKKIKPIDVTLQHLDALHDYNLALAKLERALAVRSIFAKEKEK